MIPIADDDSDLRCRPITVPLLLIACAAAWIAQLLFGEAVTMTWSAVPYELTHGMDFEHPVRVATPDGVVAIPHRPVPEAWMLWLTPLTAMFLHGSWLHFLGNMLYLHVFGDQIEDSLGRFRFLLFYLLCGLIACAAHVATAHDSPLPMLGASGAISGVLGAYMRLHPWKPVLVLVGILPLPLPAVFVLGLWFVLQWLGWRDGLEPVAYMAHIGGFVAGFVLIRRWGPRRRTAWSP
ncbi:MAG: rhomboid family intramembrane serine protease [Planctomycetota bacterium]